MQLAVNPDTIHRRGPVLASREKGGLEVSRFGESSKANDPPSPRMLSGAGVNDLFRASLYYGVSKALEDSCWP